MLQHTIERISAAIAGLSTNRCALCSTFATKCSLNPADYAMSIQVPVKTNIITFLAIQASIFNWTYLICDWWYIDNRSALYSTFTAKYRAQQLVCAMSTLVLVKPNKVIVLLVRASIFNWTYLRCDWWFIDKSMRVILHSCCQIMRASSCIRYVNHCPGRIKYIYISCYSGFNIQLNVSPLRLVVYRQIDACYTSHSC
jgi:hypothetical protein